MGAFKILFIGSLILRRDFLRNQAPMVPWDTGGLEEIYSVGRGEHFKEHHDEPTIRSPTSTVFYCQSDVRSRFSERHKMLRMHVILQMEKPRPTQSKGGRPCSTLNVFPPDVCIPL